MKKLLVSTAALALLSGAAAAADLPAFEPAPVIAPVPQVFSWTGPYAGLAAGYAWGHAEVNDFDGDDDDDDDGDEEFDADGWLVGGFVGYNYQFPSALVIGIEADLDWTGIDGDGDSGDDDDDDDDDDNHFNADLDWQGSLRGRVGYGFDRALLYATGGLALASIDTHGNGDDDDDDDDDGDGDSTEWGWTLGAGVDFAVTDNVFVRGEYRYTNYSDIENEDDRFEAQDFDTHAVRVGVGVLF